MKPIRVIYKEVKKTEKVRDFCRMKNGDWVVLVGQGKHKDSLWFNRKGEHPKSYLEFLEN